PENFWWHGQNQRTSEVGWFPRALASTGKPLDPRDISRPIKNSFIHTGHGGMNQDTWGQPGHIDDVYLRNPMDPEDLSRPGCSVQQSEFLPPTGLGPADAAKSQQQARSSKSSYHRLVEDDDKPVSKPTATSKSSSGNGSGIALASPAQQRRSIPSSPAASAASSANSHSRRASSA
uniref:non-specific protein-tyrosine kinase n=1 Tax=Macrostomum lignano TaxID=282301 RepID=A0A1I8G640_9PLAT